MFIRALLLILLCLCSFNSYSENTINKNNIDTVTEFNGIKKNNKQIFFVHSRSNANAKKLNSKLLGISGIKSRAISERLFRIDIDSRLVTRKKLKSLFAIDGVERIYPNTNISLTSLRQETTISQNNTRKPTKNRNENLQKTAYRNDYYFPLQWALENNGQGAIESIGIAEIDVGAIDAWQLTSGLSDGVIAIFGERINPNHEDLLDAYWVNALEIPDNGIDDDNNGYIDDVYGINSNEDSGSVTAEFSATNAYAGVISATQDNNIGISGLTKNDKVLTCVMNDLGIGVAEVADIVECFEYIIDLKKNRGINIHSVILDWTISGKTPDSFPWLRELVDSLIPHDIFVVAGLAHTGWPYYYRDQYTNLPAGYDSPNVIAVSSMNNLNLADSGTSSGASIGYRTVHTFAPGANIVSTGSSFVANYESEDSIFFDSFEEGSLQDWDWVGSAFSISSDVVFDGDTSLKISNLTNQNEENSHILTTKAIDLSSFQGKELMMSYQLFFSEDDADRSGGESIRYRLIYADGTIGPDRNFAITLAPLWQKKNQYLTDFNFGSDKTLEQLSQIKIQFDLLRISSWDTEIFLDKLAIAEKKADGDVPNSYVLFQGAGAAAAHVAAGISLIKDARPDLTNIQIKNLITSTGKSFDEYIGAGESRRKSYLSIANKSFKITDNTTSSVLTCENNKITRRIYPKLSGKGHFVAVENYDNKLSVLNINCAEPSGAPSVLKNGSPADLKDNGVSLDHTIGDGVYTANMASATPGDSEVNIQGDEYGSYNIRTFSPYSEPVLVDFEWEVSTEEMPRLTIGVNPEPPFVFNIGNIMDDHWDIDRVFSINANSTIIRLDYMSIETRNPLVPDELDSKGNVVGSMNSQHNRTNKSEIVPRLPTFNPKYHIIIAPYLSNISSLREGGIYQYTVGEAPNRKWIFEVNGVQEANCPEQPLLNYQTVFNETSGTIQFNYKKVGEICDGPLPGVGIQIGDQFHSIYDAPLSDEMSIRFTLPHNNYVYINQIPKRIKYLPSVRIKQSELFQLDLSEYILDDDQASLEYSIYFDDEAHELTEIDGVSISNGILTIQTREIIEDSFYIRAMDEEGLSVIVRIGVTVSGIPPSRLRGAEDYTAYIGIDLTVDLKEFFSDEFDEILTYSVDLDEQNYRIADNLLILNIAEVGVYYFAITATDSDNLSSSIYNNEIEVIQNTPPTVSAGFSNLSYYSDASIAIPLGQYFSDAQDNELSYSSENLPNQLKIENNELVGIFPDIGTYTFSITAVDSLGLSLTSSTTIVITKRPDNNVESDSSGGGALSLLMFLVLLFSRETNNSRKVRI